MFKLKKIAFLFILSVVCLPGLAQSNIRLNNFWDNTYYVNPASINVDYLAEFSTAARKQWMNLPGSPVSFFAAGTTYLDKMHMQFGLKVVQDKIGYTSSSDIGLSYAYSIKINKDWRLNMGLGVSYQMLSYDLGEMNLPSTDFDPAIIDGLLDENNFNANLGFELDHAAWKFGASSQNLFSLFSGINKQFSNINMLYAKYHPNKNELFNLGYGVCGIQYGNLYQMELNMTGYFNLSKERDQLQVGLFYRTRNQMGAILGVNLSNPMSLSYSYDFLLGGLSRSSVGTHEIILSYKLSRIPFCHNCNY